MLRQRTRNRNVQQPATDTYLESGTPLQVTVTSMGSGTSATVLVGNTTPRASSNMMTEIILKAIVHSFKSH